MTLIEFVKRDLPLLSKITESFVNEHGAQVFVFDKGEASVTIIGNSFLLVEHPSSILRRTVRRGVFADINEPVEVPLVVQKKKSWLSTLLIKLNSNRLPTEN